MANDWDEVRAGTDGFSSQDENGVDLSLIDHCLSLTPAERLRQAQATANSVLEMRHRLGWEGDPWESIERLIGSESSSS